MCDICNGRTPDQAIADLRAFIRRTGWGVQGVEPDPGSPGWAYTIGLLTSYDHPELLIVDHDIGRGAQILNSLAWNIRDGSIIEPGDAIDLGGCRAEVIDIDPHHLHNGTMAVWPRIHPPMPGGESPELEAYQVVALDPLPDGKRLPDVRLDVRHPVLGGNGPNRAQRRAARRRRTR